MQQDNRCGSEAALTTARELGLDSILHVSSFVALLLGPHELERLSGGAGGVPARRPGRAEAPSS
jgi:hypothetical protein